MTKLRLFCLGGFMLVLGAAATGIAGAQSAKPSATVEFQMYSGRHNPVVVITDPSTLAKLQSSLAKSRKLARNSLAPSREYEMGYTGTVIKNDNGVNIPDETLVHRRQIVTRSRAGVATAALSEGYAEDASGDIESALIEYAAAAGVINAKERAYLLQEAAK
ncbi:MAG TPA: hypothetical protein VFK05_20410 [Polyangiaceae bacterium]|nr:hypothetical protein [Polyangiaceae bacterium]